MARAEQPLLRRFLIRRQADRRPVVVTQCFAAKFKVYRTHHVPTAMHTVKSARRFLGDFFDQNFKYVLLVRHHTTNSFRLQTVLPRIQYVP